MGPLHGVALHKHGARQPASAPPKVDTRQTPQKGPITCWANGMIEGTGGDTWPCVEALVSQGRCWQAYHPGGCGGRRCSCPSVSCRSPVSCACRCGFFEHCCGCDQSMGSVVRHGVAFRALFHVLDVGFPNTLNTTLDRVRPRHTNAQTAGGCPAIIFPENAPVFENTLNDDAASPENDAPTQAEPEQLQGSERDLFAVSWGGTGENPAAGLLKKPTEDPGLSAR